LLCSLLPAAWDLACFLILQQTSNFVSSNLRQERKKERKTFLWMALEFVVVAILISAAAVPKSPAEKKSQKKKKKKKIVNGESLVE
jgi:uncharacterized membrane protein YadS